MATNLAPPNIIVLEVQRSLLALRAVQPVRSPEVFALTALPPSYGFQPVMGRVHFAVNTVERPLA